MLIGLLMKAPNWSHLTGVLLPGLNPSIPAALKGGRADSAVLQEFMTKMAARDYTPTGRLSTVTGPSQRTRLELA